MAAEETKIEKIKSETEKLKEAREKKNLVPFLRSLRGDGLPAYPSAQLWNHMTKKEQSDLQKAVVDWDDYEAEMKRHWPPPIRLDRKREIFKRA